MDSWLSVHSQAYSKVYLIYGLLFAWNLGSLIIFSVFYCKSKYSLEYLIEDDPDIDLTGLKNFSFTKAYDVEYSLGISNLGTTGKLYLNCFTGKCHYEYSYSCTTTRCSGSGSERECETVDDTCYESYSKEDHLCSEQCRRSGASSCGRDYCSLDHYDDSSCSHDDGSKSIEHPKSCNAENLILYWGNSTENKLYYKRVNNTRYKTLSYLNSAVTANESCPNGTKMCGILDNLGNKLCYPEYLNCPLNYITTNLSDSNYRYYGSVKLNNKTIYFTNEATENGKIIGGLFVDSDLLIKYNDEDCEKLEEGSVSDLLDNHPYKLYKNSLSYDPYKDRSNLVQTGKSYLKWCVPGVGKEKNISKIKELKIDFDFNVTTNNDIINPIKTFSTSSYFVSLPGYIGLFLVLIIFIFSFFEQNSIHSNVGGVLRCSNSINWLLFLIFLVSSLLVFVGTILACVNIGNISRGNKLDLQANIISSLKSLNITIICVSIVLIIIIFIFFIYLYITPKSLPDQESITQYKTYNNNKDDYYNSSDFRYIDNNNYDNSDNFHKILLTSAKNK